MKFEFANLAVAAVAAIGIAVGATAAVAGGMKKDIVDTAVEAGQFTTLAAALGAAGLVETLKGPGPFTVFAPTDDAFAKLPAGTVENLLKPENKDQLVAILTYHVVPGSVMAADVVNLSRGDHRQRRRRRHRRQRRLGDDQRRHRDATDIAASNGVIHVIDTVILPPSG
jgi:uncharacterized surface protein with fasciclin (FAS1) repeats